MTAIVRTSGRQYVGDRTSEAGACQLLTCLRRREGPQRTHETEEEEAKEQKGVYPTSVALGTTVEWRRACSLAWFPSRSM